MAAPVEVSKKCSNFRIRQFKEKRHFNIAANLTLNTMVSFVILLIVCTARLACADRHTDKHTHETTTVTFAAHARRGLITTHTMYCTVMNCTLRQTHTRDNYCNLRCACAPRVNNHTHDVLYCHELYLKTNTHTRQLL